METRVVNHIEELKVDAVFYMMDPVRICKVVSIGKSLDVYNPITQQLESQPSCEVLTILPTMKIKGLVNQMQADQNKTISDALEAVSKAEEAETGEVFTLSRPAKTNNTAMIIESFAGNLTIKNIIY